jgi:hypothetical protein
LIVRNPASTCHVSPSLGRGGATHGHRLDQACHATCAWLRRRRSRSCPSSLRIISLPQQGMVPHPVPKSCPSGVWIIVLPAKAMGDHRHGVWSGPSLGCGSKPRRTSPLVSLPSVPRGVQRPRSRFRASPPSLIVATRGHPRQPAPHQHDGRSMVGGRSGARGVLS